RTPSEQPHEYMSLYTDTSNYYLTWTTSTPGKRISNFYNSDYTGKTTDEWIWYHSPRVFNTDGSLNSDEFYDGSPYNSPGFYSEYTEGEGWFSSYIAASRTALFGVNTEHYNSSGPTPEYEFAVYGKSDPIGTGAIINGINHEIQASIGSTILLSQKHRGYTKIVKSGSLDASLMGTPTTDFDFKSIYLTKGRHAVSYIIVDYPRNLTMNNASTFGWKYTGNNTYFEFTDYSGSNPWIYDLTNNRRIQGDVTGSTLQFNSSSVGEKELFISDQSAINTIPASNIKLKNVTKVDYSSTDYNFIIITNPFLASSAADYKAYRESPEGGSYNVLVVETPDLYENFYYGYHHPVALRNFCKKIYDEQPNHPTHVLLLGKGQSYNLMRFEYERRQYEDLVPTWGIPSSDYFFVTDYEPNDFSPAMAIGRVPARINSQVQNYLYKLKLHESHGNKSKVVLQLTGGETAAEQAQLKSHQQTYKSIFEGEKFGGKSISIAKADAQAVDSSLVSDIQAVINDGTNLISYFGHGASQVLEIDMGKPQHLENEGKYPLFLFNGCALGNSYGDVSLPEDFLLQEKTGAVAWIASSAFGFIPQLYSWTQIFYKRIYNLNYGESIGEVIAKTTKEYQNPLDNFNRSQCRQMVLHGDPAIKLYTPLKPDYTIQDNVRAYPEDANAELDSFAIDFTLENFGMASSDTPSVFVSLKYSNDTIRKFGPYTYGRINTTKDVRIWFPNGPYSNGFHTFTITVDYGDSIAELAPFGELNNTYEYTYYMPSNSLSVLKPKKDGIIPDPEVILEVQNNNILAGNVEVIFEIDTTPLYNSPVLQNSGVITGSNIIKHRFILPPFDSTDFFWRARYNKPANEGGTWENSTFALIHNSPVGWSQGYYSKLGETTKDRIKLDSNKRNIEFTKTIGDKFVLNVAGRGTHVTKRNMYIGFNKTIGRYLWNGVEVIAIDPDNLDRISYPSVYNRIVAGRDHKGFKYHIAGEYSGVFWFDTRNAAVRDSLLKHLHKIPEKYMVFMMTSGTTANDQWADTLFQAIEDFGAIEIRNVPDGYPYGLFGERGLAPGKATELVANVNSSADPETQQANFASVLYPISTEGIIKSQKIGPATEWKEFYKRKGKTYDSPEDSVYYRIIGVRQSETEDLLVDKIYNSSLDISNIDAYVYPYLKIEAHFKDEIERTPEQQERWTILYEGVPEGTIQPSIAYHQSHDTIQEGDSISFEVAYQNISNYSMDSVLVLAINRKSDNLVDTIERKYYYPLLPNDSVILTYKFDTRGLTGNNRFTIIVNPDFDQPEEKLENNVLDLRYLVLNDERNPLLDVVFDGVHILDEDIVSPNTVITMSVLDENEFIFIDNPSSFDVIIQKVNESGNPYGPIDSILHTRSDVVFYPATKPGEKAVLEYSANELESGTYRLTVVVTDASGNVSSDLKYQINFKVVREATISNIYPYPNPFTTSMKFVYTLTGEQIPDYMKIQILTVTGKIVREITQSELGHIKIGNNISEFSWDGTDEFGDQLANGVYLYKVVAKIDGEDIERYETAGDNFFTQGFGKIYLMR
ncbi:MAG: hypothetical protein HKP14_06860, partial [Bacteroidia bacterium]|nr:hypothetical protein [Bacteroidia bacterium]